MGATPDCPTCPASSKPDCKLCAPADLTAEQRAAIQNERTCAPADLTAEQRAAIQNETMEDTPSPKMK